MPDPPSAPDTARLLDAAFEMDDDWGTLVWVVMTTGIRRGGVCALRWRHVDLDGETIEILRADTLHGVSASRRAPRPTRCASVFSGLRSTEPHIVHATRVADSLAETHGWSSRLRYDVCRGLIIALGCRPPDEPVRHSELVTADRHFPCQAPSTSRQCAPRG
ncbi:hypothetical protein CFP66_34220 [Pseudonocardia sp. MH-G8]|nr:hypothetical protein CFP66_34220 [Pseudonocardia sp. MH-G8]